MATAEISLAVQFPGTYEIGLAVNMSASEEMIGEPQVTMLDEEGRTSAVMKYGPGGTIIGIDLYEYGDGTMTKIAIPAECEDYSALETTITDMDTQETTETTSPITMQMVQKVIRLTAGAGEDFLPIGMEVNMPWTDEGGTEYENPMILVAYREMNKEGDPAGVLTRVGIFRSKYATKQDLPLDAAEANEAGRYTLMNLTYYGRKANYSQGGVTYTWSVLIPHSVPGYDLATYKQTYTVYEHSYLDRSYRILQYGYSRWEKSAWRKYLNSDAADGAWWSASHTGDMPPANIDSVRGYMAGLREEDLAAIATVRVQTALCPAVESGMGPSEARQETFWLASVEEMNGVSPAPTGEGGCWAEYWEQQGMNSATNNATECRKIYRIDDHETAAFVRLRTCSQANEGSGYIINTTGQVFGNYVNVSNRGVVCCAVG